MAFVRRTSITRADDFEKRQLYTYASVHGRGAGSDLLSAVIDPVDSAGLWVADPNPRAQAFYRKHGFEFDGNSRIEDGVRAIRMTRPALSSR